MSGKYITLFLLLMCLVLPSSAWVDGYANRVSHMINGSTYWNANQEGYTVRFIVSNTTGSNSGENLYFTECLPSWYDIKFTTNTSNTTLPAFKGYENATSAEIYVKIPDIYKNAETNIWIYYENPSETELATDLPSTICDHFDGDAYNTSMWNIDAWGADSISNSILLFHSGYVGTSHSIYSDVSRYSRNTSMVIRYHATTMGAVAGTYDGYVRPGIYSGFNAGGIDLDGFLYIDDTHTPDILDADLLTYNIWKIIYNNTYTELYKNDALYHADKNVSVGNTSTTLQFNVIYDHLYIDYILSIPYVYPEPLHSTYGTAESSNVTANFTADNTTGEAPFTVDFTDTSLNATTWAWDIDNDGVTDYITQNCTHTYTEAGLYSVKLVASIGAWSDDELKEDYISVTGVDTGYGSQYAPHTVRFLVQDYYGSELKDIHVTATPFTTTMGSWTWLQYLYGMDPRVDIEDSTLTGMTGTDGSLSFIMLESVGYSMRFYNTTKGIDQTLTIYPKQEEEFIYLDYNKPNTTVISESVVWNLTSELNTNSTYTLSLYYNDSVNGTTSTLFFVRNENGTNQYTSTVSYPTNETFTYLLPYWSGESFAYGFNSSTTSMGTINITRYVVYPEKVDIEVDDTWLTWISTGIILVFAAIFSRGTTAFGVIIVPAIAGLLIYIGWISLSMTTIVTMLLTLGVLIYLKEKYRKGGT